MNRADLLKWMDDYEAMAAENAKLTAENAKLTAENAKLAAQVAAQEAIVAELRASAQSVHPDRARLEKKYARVRFAGKCTLRQFTQAAHASLYTGKLPSGWQALFDAYFAELEEPFGLTKTLTHVVGAMPL